MQNVVLVVNGDKILQKRILRLFNKEFYKIVLMGLFPPSTGATKVEAERSQWQDLFSLREELEPLGFAVSIVTEKGSVFNLINTVQMLSADVVILPKEKFLTLAQDEFEDFLTQLPGTLILY